MRPCEPCATPKPESAWSTCPSPIVPVRAVARHLGAEVAIVARHDAQRRAAEALGLALDAPRDCEVVFEAAGTSSGFDDAVRACRRAGKIGLVSTTWEPIPISFLNAQMRE